MLEKQCVLRCGRSSNTCVKPPALLSNIGSWLCPWLLEPATYTSLSSRGIIQTNDSSHFPVAKTQLYSARIAMNLAATGRCCCSRLFRPLVVSEGFILNWCRTGTKMCEISWTDTHNTRKTSVYKRHPVSIWDLCSFYFDTCT